MAYVEKRGENSWRLNVTTGYKANGKPMYKRKTIKAKNQTAAKKELAKFVTEVEEGTFVNPSKLKFANFVEEWRKKHAQKYLAASTLSSYDAIIQKRLIPVFGDMKISDIKPLHIIDFLDDLGKEGKRADGKDGALSQASIHYNYRVLKNIFTRAVKWELIQKNPVDGADKPKVKNKEAQAYDLDEVAELHASLKDEPLDKQALINLVLATGLRRGEVLGLEWESVDLENGVIHVKQSLVRLSGPKNEESDKDRNDLQKNQSYQLKETKTDKARTVSLSPGLIKLMSRYKVESYEKRLKADNLWEGGEYFFVFSSWHGKPLYPSSLTTWWRRFLKRKELRFIRFHDLRHTSATALLNQGVHAKVISQRLGHNNINTTMNIYGHVLRSADQEAADHFDDIFSGKHREKNIK